LLGLGRFSSNVAGGTAFEQATDSTVCELIEVMPHLVWIAGADGAIHTRNQRWLTYSGLPAFDAHSPEDITSIIHPDDAIRYWDCWRLARDTCSTFETDARLRRSGDGVYRWHLCRAVPSFDKAGHLERWVGTYTDIHSQKSAEISKDEFLATLSHELRTPLNVILGWTDLLKKGGVRESEFARVFGIIERNTRIQIRLIGDFLDLSRIVTGKLQLDPRPTPFDEVVRLAARSLEVLAREKEVDVVVLSELGSAASTVFGDGLRLQQVVWNMLANAIKFTPRGGRVEVALLTSGHRVLLRVRDSGVGIDPEFLPFVFERFRQEDASSTRSHGGLGLGLALVKQLVELHGGSVSATSCGKGRGAEFVLELPVYRPNDGTLGNADKSELLPAEPSVDHGHTAAFPSASFATVPCSTSASSPANG
jgi:signal transduction histidine kinase